MVATEFNEEEEGEDVFVDAASARRRRQNRVSWRARQDSARSVFKRLQGRSLGSRIRSLTQKFKETIVSRRSEESNSCNEWRNCKLIKNNQLKY